MRSSVGISFRVFLIFSGMGKSSLFSQGDAQRVVDIKKISLYHILSIPLIEGETFAGIFLH